MTLAAAGGGNDIFLLPNSTFFVCLLIFVLMLWVFNKFIVPPLAKAMREREEMLKKQAEDRAQAAKRLEQAKERYDSSLAEARAESTKIKDEARADAEKIRQQLRSETDEEIARVRAEGLAALEEQRTAAVGNLRGEIGGLSTDLAGRILGTPMGADGPQKSTIESYLAELASGDSGKQSVEGRADAEPDRRDRRVPHHRLGALEVPAPAGEEHDHQPPGHRAEAGRRFCRGRAAQRRGQAALRRGCERRQQEAARLRDDARADATRIKEELIEQAKAEVERMKQRGQDQLVAERDQLVRGLRSQVGGQSMELAERLVREKLSMRPAGSAFVLVPRAAG